MAYFDEISTADYKVPDECPMCHHGIEPILIRGYSCTPKGTINYQHRLIFQCPKNECLELFIAYYHRSPMDVYSSYMTYSGSAPFKFRGEDFEEVVSEISPQFVKIYNQSEESERRKLDEICGLGYRKAFEFLIKDYLVAKHPEKEDEIKNSYKFSQLIKDYVTDEKVKLLAERTSWLGNDHAHYTKKWVDKDIGDLKRLIKTSLHWIIAENAFDHYMNEME